MKVKWRKCATVLIAALMFTASSLSVVAAVQGDANNPLVSLSYITDIFTKSILKETDTKLAETKTAYANQLDSKILAYTEELKKLANGSGTSASSLFSVVTVPSGQTLVGGVGCEVMLRVGSAQCVSSGTPGLINSTTGGTLEHGGALVKNNLYMITIEGRGIKAVGGECKLMVRGSYTLQ